MFSPMKTPETIYESSLESRTIYLPSSISPQGIDCMHRSASPPANLVSRRFSMNDEQETFSEFVDDRHKLFLYGVHLLDPFTASLRIPNVVSVLLERFRKNHGGIPESAKQETQDNSDLHKLWEAASWEEVRDNLLFIGPSFGSIDGNYRLNHKGNGEMYMHLMRDTVDRLFPEAPTPDILYGYSRGSLDQPDTPHFPSWIIDEGEATSSDLFYPFLIVKMQGHGAKSSGCMHRATNECMVASSICVRMIDKLNQRLAERHGQFEPLNCAVFSIALNGAVARVYVTFAWDENIDHMCKVDSFLLEDPEHHWKLHKLIRSIVAWGNEERRRQIIDAISTIRLKGPRWYPRYE
ncbi:hypothetical protein FSARC_8249 [Fusarium sarcochroum]|uniref:DUF7924 domain-containing protein n=1 Tax=Fusarium sarcochroum TaxID=1208366 RepID=A0A8H4X7F0_9HYPO|nr:hypothetical protein FSARC_8249 [Fusarium sarcochroum]